MTADFYRKRKSGNGLSKTGAYCKGKKGHGGGIYEP